MKKLFTVALVALVSLGASAQLISSNMVTKEKKAGYSRIGLSYSSLTFGEKGADAVSGVSLDLLKGINVSSSLPLYIETGLGINFGWNSDEDSDRDYEYKTNFTYLDLRVPINVTYRYEVIEGLKVSPFIGLYLKGNILGNVHEEYSYKSGNSWYSDEDDWNVYSEDDLGDDAATRFNVGIDFGVNVDWKKFYFGISYAKDFNKFYGYKKAGGMGKFSATIGFVY